MDAFTQGYMLAIEFTDIHSDNPEVYATSVFSKEFEQSIEKDCTQFQNAYAELLQQYQEVGFSLSDAGQDFWLTRNGHGAGFWDRGLPGSLGDALTKAAKSFGMVDVYAGDDGIYGN